MTKEVSTSQYCAYGVFDIAGPSEHYQIKWGQNYVGDGGRKMPPSPSIEVGSMYLLKVSGDKSPISPPTPYVPAGLRYSSNSRHAEFKREKGTEFSST